MIETTYREAIGMALRDAMADDEAIVIIGEEVGAYGGAYGVTKGLLQEFGAERVIDTPISEAGIVGAAIGAAMTELRPVAELIAVPGTSSDAYHLLRDALRREDPVIFIEHKSLYAQKGRLDPSTPDGRLRFESNGSSCHARSAGAYGFRRKRNCAFCKRPTCLRCIDRRRCRDSRAP